MKFILPFVVLCLVLPFSLSRAEETQNNQQAIDAAPHLDPNNSVRVLYTNTTWNKNASKLDSATVIMREGSGGRMVQLHLTETEPDSGKFSGVFSISFRSIEKFKVEFYVPPQQEAETQEALKKLSGMITSGKLLRNAYILRRTPTGQQTVEIFDTREQAQAALKAYKAEQQLTGLQNQKIPSDQQMELTKRMAEAAALAAAAAANVERARIEQLEAQKIAELQAKQAALNKAEKERRKKEAEALAGEAMQHYQANQLKESVEKFAKAVELDPDNHGYYFQYGVALYKVESFDKALLYLGLADGPQVNQDEKNFFLGLAHFRLKEFPKAIPYFDQVATSKNPEVGSAAKFYKGVALFEQKNWPEARAAFQIVLDTSSDVELDKRAETYLEQVLRIQQFEMERSRKWQVSATVGEQFDSNVTLTSDSTLAQGAQTNISGYRSLFMGSGRYRPVFDETHEFATQLDVLYMYTIDNSFNYSQNLRNADPMVVTLTMPWTHKGLMFGKGFKSDIIAGYESITMSVEDNTPKEIISSYLLNFNNLFVMNERLFSNFNLELRRDRNEMSSLTGDNDSTAIKAKLLNSNLHFFSENKSKIITSEFAFTINSAVGNNSTYNRFDLGVGYIQPFYWESAATFKLAYYYLSYPMKTDNRLDNDYSLTAGLSKKINDNYSTGLVGIYTINNSNSSTYAYNKWSCMLTFSATKAF